MKKTAKPGRKAILFGILYLIFQQTVLPLLLSAGNALLPNPLSRGALNFTYFCINFTIITLFFGDYLLRSLEDARKNPMATVWSALLGYLGNESLGRLLTVILILLYPRFANINDLSIALMLQEDFALMAIGSILLVPVAEETLFRGVLFRGLYERSPAAAYLVSMTAFSAAHVVGYIGSVEPMLILLSFIQYLPSGYALCFTYRRSGSIWAPILMHVAVNAVAVYSMR